MRETILSTYQFILDLLFPAACIFCGREGNYFCLNCAAKIPTNAPNCFVCQKRSPEGKICRNCSRKTKIRRFFAGYHYENEFIKKAIRKFKYNFIKDLSEPLGNLLVNFLKNYFPKNLEPEKFLIIPVPLSKQRYSWRGFNQSELLAKIIAHNFRLPLETEVLIRFKNTIPQAEIKNIEERKENIKNAFVVKKPEIIKNKIVILVDDISTIGATLEECAIILKAAGAKQIWAIVVAR
ncbi:MAG: ComF family protein [Parcubacteria group bacterium]|nr:ComF family protein [Parcubacteria group bacterium]